jgi:hypothetical protein
MTTPDPLDTAIDHVASRMVAVPDDTEMTLRIVSALPERTSRRRWLIPQFAAIGALVIALVWTTRNESTPEIAMLPSSAGTSIIGFASPVAADAPGTALRTMPLESAFARGPAVAASGQGGGRTEATVPIVSVDHERALPAINALSALSVTDARTSEIAMPAAIGLASIEIADLKLTAESFTPQKEE